MAAVRRDPRVSLVISTGPQTLTVKGRCGLPEDRETPILVVCETGNRSLSGALFLTSLGYRDVRSINGGTSGWREKGFAVSDD